MVVKNKHGIDELREDKWLDGPGSGYNTNTYVSLLVRLLFYFFCVFFGRTFPF